MKTFLNSFIGKVLVVAFAIAIHAAFALGAYYLGTFIATIIFPEAPQAYVPIGGGYALMTFVGAIWVFIYGEYAYEDIDSYRLSTGTDFRSFFWIVLVAIGLNEVSSLAFRVYNTHGVVPQTIIATSGLLFLVIAFCLGKIIHAMANRSQVLMAKRAKEAAGRKYYDQSAKYTEDMNPDELYRFSKGDPNVMNEVAQRKQDKEAQKDLKAWQKEQRKHEKQAGKQDREQAKRREYEDDQSFFGKMFDRKPPKPKADPDFPAAQSNHQADHLSQNGRSHN